MHASSHNFENESMQSALKLVILDNRMPGISGLEVAKIFRASKDISGLKLALYSADDHVSSIYQAEIDSGMEQPLFDFII